MIFPRSLFINYLSMIHSPEEFNIQKYLLPDGQYHQKARQEKPVIYPDRVKVLDGAVAWEVSLPGYKPEYIVAPSVLENDATKKSGGWADPEDFSQVTRKLQSYEESVRMDKKTGKPLNPKGRTGLEGRGSLGKWGANFAADPMITRVNPDTGNLEMIAIQRKDTKQLAIPGGMVDYGEDITQTLQRELEEETGVKVDMTHADLVYQGYVDDPRNTDNAWMETSAKHIHVSDAEARSMQMIAGDDAQSVQWLLLTPETVDGLYASHAVLVRAMLKHMQKKNQDQLSQKIREQIQEICK